MVSALGSLSWSSESVLCGTLRFGTGKIGAEQVSLARHTVVDAFEVWLPVACQGLQPATLYQELTALFAASAAGEGLTNAYKHCCFDPQANGEDGYVEVTWRGTADLFHLEVSNPMNTAKKLPSIAEATADATVGREPDKLPEGGMGLGIIRRIVEDWPDSKARCELKADKGRALFIFEVRR